MDILTVKEVAQLLRLSQWAVREGIKSGALRAARFGHIYRIRRCDAEAWFAASCAGMGSAAEEGPR